MQPAGFAPLDPKLEDLFQLAVPNQKNKGKYGKMISYRKKFAEGSLEVKLSTIWTDGKADVGRAKEEKKRSAKIREEKEREERRCRCAKK